jgi:hypothetical protein
MQMIFIKKSFLNLKELRFSEHLQIYTGLHDITSRKLYFLYIGGEVQLGPLDTAPLIYRPIVLAPGNYDD